MQLLDGHIVTIGNPDDWEGAAELGQAEEFMDKKQLKKKGLTPHKKLIADLKRKALAKK